MADILLFGAGAIADVAHACIDNDSPHSVVGFVVDADYANAPTHRGLPMVSLDRAAERFAPDEHRALVAIGYHDMNRLRLVRLAEMEALGYTLHTHVGSGGWARTEAEPGAFVMDGRSLQPEVRVGRGAFIWAGANIGHHSTVGASAWITSGASVGGHADIGARAFLGLGCTVGHRVSVGEGAFIGAAAKVSRDVAAAEVHVQVDAQKGALDADRFLRFAVRG